MKHIFISHAGDDKVIAKTLHDDLRNVGHDVKIDLKELTFGDDTIDFMNEAIANAHTVVILYSKHTQKAKWQRLEINAAVWNQTAQAGGKVIVLKLDETALPPLLGPRLYGSLQESDYQNTLKKLCQDITARLWIVYSEPEEYEIDGNLPLSFGISRVEQIAGFSASPDASRPLHVAMFLGYEGDRAFATFELLQPKKTTLMIPDPPFRASWQGRTEQQNRNLLALVDQTSIVKVDSLDPDSSFNILEQTLGPVSARSDFARALCPLGTKPQIVGAYKYLRVATDPPAVIYTGALRHNHSFYSRGVGNSWLIHRPS